MNYLIAIDGGGTKTESVLFTCSGIVLSRYITKGVNALDVGIEKSKVTPSSVSAAIPFCFKR